MTTVFVFGKGKPTKKQARYSLQAWKAQSFHGIITIPDFTPVTLNLFLRGLH